MQRLRLQVFRQTGALVLLWRYGLHGRGDVLLLVFLDDAEREPERHTPVDGFLPLIV